MLSFSRINSNPRSLQGFTLIELLVTIIIVGVLSSIALPSFLNQVGKARGTEAKANLGTINRSQQAYRLENNTMATSASLLDARDATKFYTYQITAVNSNVAVATTSTKQEDLKVYSTRAEQNGDRFNQIICESNDTTSLGTSAPAPSNTLICETAYKNID